MRAAMISAILKAKPESLRGNAVRRFVIEKDKDAMSTRVEKRRPRD